MVAKPAWEYLENEKNNVNQLANEHKHSAEEEKLIRNKLDSYTCGMRNNVEQHEIDQKSGVPMAPILTVAGAAAGAGVASVLRLGIFPVLGLGLLCGIVGGVSGKTISQNQKGSKSNTLVEEYKKQLSALGSEITNKVSSIDGKEPSGLYQ